MPFKDPEAQKLYDRLKYLRNREKIIQRSRERTKNKRDEINTYQRDYARKHRERKNAQRREWRARSPEVRERDKLAQREWRKKNPDKAKQNYERYIAKN